MQKIKDGFWVWNQPQLLSLFVTILIIFIISLVVFIKIKKESKPDKAPSKTILVAETYVQLIDNNYDDVSGGKLPSARFYIFSVTTFLLVGNMLGLIGIDPIASSYSVTLTLGAITFFGIYVIGIWFQKWYFFLRYVKNPTEFLGQFSPLISLGLRMFGNIIGGAVIMASTYYAGGWLWGLIFPGPQLYFFSVILTPWMHLFFDVFGAAVQALIFTVLTTIYWTNEVDNNLPEKHNKSKRKVISLNKGIY
ncbi:F0F1 ATP synthase subunit A [Mycoplasmopsis bovigenitalium]|uniref:F0F1 ATP synthase subunit A n=1 Tax=Mycoplasmopsis bovigenitalium TaxID=2112 RepID=UPI00090C4A87|nr:F0F1 ATP synthase subunit A [Mycoplasmopsis bovigenitalium]BAW18030.1 F0F1 ATP synthase subunit A [Mycoplasmopsis bovigenitalium]